MSMPADFLCPITHEAMTDPVVASDGHSYERCAILKWIGQRLIQGHAVLSPLTNEVLPSTHVVPNVTLRKLIDGHKEHVRDIEKGIAKNYDDKFKQIRAEKTLLAARVSKAESELQEMKLRAQQTLRRALDDLDSQSVVADSKGSGKGLLTPTPLENKLSELRAESTRQSSAAAAAPERHAFGGLGQPVRAFHIPGVTREPTGASGGEPGSVSKGKGKGQAPVSKGKGKGPPPAPPVSKGKGKGPAPVSKGKGKGRAAYRPCSPSCPCRQSLYDHIVSKGKGKGYHMAIQHLSS